MGAHWEQDFDFYLALIDGTSASFRVDLDAADNAPVETHPVRLALRISMLAPRPDGLRSDSEMQALADVEDRCAEAVQRELDAIYVGRTLHAGRMTQYFYLPADQQSRIDRLSDLLGPLGEYEPQWQVADDPEWTLCREFLAPGGREYQRIWNRRLISVFEKHGDDLTKTREVDHVALFPNRELAFAAAVELRAAGFRTDEPSGPDGDDPRWALEFHRNEHLSEHRPDEFVDEILDILEKHQGDYDGWGASQV